MKEKHVLHIFFFEGQSPLYEPFFLAYAPQREIPHQSKDKEADPRS